MINSDSPVKRFGFSVKRGGVGLNFEPSRSDERRMNKLLRKSDQLGMERMWRVTVEACSSHSGRNYFLTCHILAHFLPFISSQLVSCDLERSVALERRYASRGQRLPDSFGRERSLKSDSQFNAASLPPLHDGLLLCPPTICSPAAD